MTLDKSEPTVLSQCILLCIKAVVTVVVAGFSVKVVSTSECQMPESLT